MLIARRALGRIRLPVSVVPRHLSTAIPDIAPSPLESYDHGISSEKMIGVTVGQYFDQQGEADCVPNITCPCFQFSQNVLFICVWFRYWITSGQTCR